MQQPGACLPSLPGFCGSSMKRGRSCVSRKRAGAEVADRGAPPEAPYRAEVGCGREEACVRVVRCARCACYRSYPRNAKLVIQSRLPCSLAFSSWFHRSICLPLWILQYPMCMPSTPHLTQPSQPSPPAACHQPLLSRRPRASAASQRTFARPWSRTPARCTGSAVHRPSPRCHHHLLGRPASRLTPIGRPGRWRQRRRRSRLCWCRGLGCCPGWLRPAAAFVLE